VPLNWRLRREDQVTLLDQGGHARAAGGAGGKDHWQPGGGRGHQGAHHQA